VRSRKRGNFVPDDGAAFLPIGGGGATKGETVHTLGIDMELAMIVAAEAFKKLRQSALCSVAAVHKG
jgi:hypothetical protein